MSRIGNTPISVPKEVTVTVHDTAVTVAGPKGQLEVKNVPGIVVEFKDGVLTVSRKGDSKMLRANHGTIAALLTNAIAGVTRGWSKVLELTGVGYRAAVEGQNLVLTVGFSHQVKLAPPKGITFAVTDGKVSVSGIDKYMVGQTASSVRAVKPPEPYKGKGIRYAGERVRKKAGKSAKAVGGAPGAK